MIALAHMWERVHQRWKQLGLTPIRLMGHKIPSTSRVRPRSRCAVTRTLPGELEPARELLDRFLAVRTTEDDSHG